MLNYLTTLFALSIIILSSSEALSNMHGTRVDRYIRSGFATALTELKPLVAGEDAVAHYNLGAIYYRKELEQSVKWYRLAAEGGLAEAQFNLGVIYSNKEGENRGFREAAKWYRLAAKQGFTFAQHNLGVMHDHGIGMLENNTAALTWYQLAAEKGYAPAQSNLGVLYAKGEGVSQDYEAAVRWFRLATKQGHAKTYYNLGVLYEDDAVSLTGKITDATKLQTSFYWYRQAAERGVAKAQFNLGLMYAMGKGTHKNNQHAHVWFNLAGSKGLKLARHYRMQVEKQLTNIEIARAKNFAKQWVTEHENQHQTMLTTQ